MIPAVSIIIPAYNAEQTIARALKAIELQVFKGEIEVIVVDDGSTDQTAQIIKKYPCVTYVSQTNQGPACARNHGARLAKANILLFTDADCIPHVDWVDHILKGFKSDDIGAVAGSYGIANGHSKLARCVQAEIVYRHHVLMPEYIQVFGSYNVAIKKEIFVKVGGFSTTYRSASGEDNDLSYKIANLGVKIYFQRLALVDHYHPEDVGRYLYEQYRHGYWRVALYAHHPTMKRGDGYTFWKDIVELPASFIFIGLLFLGLVNFFWVKLFIIFSILF